MNEEHDLMTTVEVAAALRVSKMTACRMIADDQLDAIRVGRAWRIKRAPLQAFLDGRTEDKAQ